MNSLKSLDDKIKYFCYSASTIVKKYISDEASTFVSNNNEYPLIFATPTKMRIQKGQVEYIINLSVLDIVYSNSDKIKILSDLAILVTELITYLDDDQNSTDNRHYFVSLNEVTEPMAIFSAVDNVCGWQFDLVFKVAFSAIKAAIR